MQKLKLSIDEMERKKRCGDEMYVGNWILTPAIIHSSPQQSTTAMGKTKPQPTKGDDGMDPNA